MAEKQETIEDIIAEMRFHGQQNIDAEKDKPEYGILTMEGRIAQNYADRLEAAHRREKAEWVNANAGLAKLVDIEKAGDCAKLREALKQVNELNVLWFDTFTLPDGATSIHDEIEDVISAALAAPPRNCDMPYNDRVEMYGAFKDWCNAMGHTMEPKLAYDAFEWLLALTTEKEGGAK